VDEKQKYWLLRIEQTLYGPFKTDKVVDLITKGRVSEIDEACLPRGRWGYIRDLKDFMRAIELQRKINDSKKIGGAGTLTEGVDVVLDDKTRELKSLDPMTSTLQIPQISREELLTSNDNGLGGSPLGAFGQSPVKSNIKKVLFVFVLVLVLAGAATAFVLKDQISTYITDTFTEKPEEDPMLAWSFGDYTKTYKLFKMKEKFQDDHPLKYAALVLKNTKDSNLVLSLLDSVAPAQQKSNIWINLKAVAHLFEEDFIGAENTLKTIDTDANILKNESVFNLAMLEHLQGEWSQSRYLFESILSFKDANQLEASVFYYLDAWIQSLIEANAIEREYLKVASFINNVLNSESVYKYEVSILAFWLIDTQKLDAYSFPDLEDRFLSYDPEIIFDKYESPYVDNEMSLRFSEYCGGLKRSKYIQLSCQLLENKDSLSSIELPTVAFGDTNMLALVSFIYNKLGNTLKANEFLVKSIERVSLPLSPVKFFVQARFCHLNGNFVCAEEYWLKALELEPYAPTALVGLSEEYHFLEKEVKAEAFYEKSKQYSKDLVSFKKLSHTLQVE